MSDQPEQPEKGSSDDYLGLESALTEAQSLKALLTAVQLDAQNLKISYEILEDACCSRASAEVKAWAKEQIAAKENDLLVTVMQLADQYNAMKKPGEVLKVSNAEEIAQILEPIPIEPTAPNTSAQPAAANVADTDVTQTQTGADNPSTSKMGL